MGSCFDIYYIKITKSWLIQFKMGKLRDGYSTLVVLAE